MRTISRDAPGARYDERYARSGWYWGTRPTGLAREFVRRTRGLLRPGSSVLDLGSGEGRDAIYLARRGFAVEGLDLSRVGVAKAAARAARLGVPARVRCADVRTVRLAARYDALLSSGVVNHLPERMRRERFAYFQSMTRRGGVHAVNAFVPMPYLSAAPEVDPAEQRFRSGELLGYYGAWRVLDAGQFEFDCRSSGVPHRHAMDYVIAQRP